MQSIKPNLQNKLINSYKHMITIHHLDNRAIILQKTGLMHTYPCAHGHEAIATAVAEHLNMDDVFVPYYRDHGVLLARNATPIDILNYWSGKRHLPKTGENDLPLCIPIATQCSHAAGVAYAMKLKNKNTIALCSLGDGATSKGDFYEAINFASIHNLPVVYLISNNQWAISTPIKLQSAANNLTDIADALNCKNYVVDGTNIFATTTVLSEAIQYCRTYSVPVVIEATTYRLGNHTTVDDATRYMPKDELEQARQNCPIKNLHKYLIDKKLITQTQVEKINAEIITYIDKCADAAVNTKPNNFNSIFDNVYAEMPNCLKEQKHQLEKLYE